MFQGCVGKPALIGGAKRLEQSGEVTLAEPWTLAAVVYVLVIAETKARAYSSGLMRLAAVVYVLVIAETVLQDSTVAASQARSPIPAGREV